MMTTTRKSSRTQVLVLFLAGLISQLAHASVIPGRWEKVSELESGTTLRVELKNGDQVEGDLASLSLSEVELDTYSARAVIPKADIQRMSVLLPDGLGDGAAIGAAIGLGLGFGVMGIAILRGNRGDDLSGAPLLAMLVGGLGAAMGAACDSGTKSVAIVVYEAPGTP